METGDLKSRLRQLWADVLNTKTVGDDEHFLELGGDSIAATLCLNTVADEFDIVMPMGLLLEDNVTFGAFATEVEQALTAAASAASPA